MWWIFYRSTIRDKIIPHAVSWYTGEAAQDEYGDIDDDEDDEDDEDDDEDEDEEEDDDEEEDEEESKTKKKVPNSNFGSSKLFFISIFFKH